MTTGSDRIDAEIYNEEKASGEAVSSNSLLEASYLAWKDYTCAQDDFETYERWINANTDFVFGNWGVNMSQAQYFYAGFIAASNDKNEGLTAPERNS